MLSCIYQERKIYAFETPDNIRDLSNQRVLLCPGCGAPVIFHRLTEKKRAYFAHKSLSGCTFCDDETEEKKMIKEHWYKRLKELYPSAKIELEEVYFINDKKYISDIVISHSNNQKWALEIVCNNVKEGVWEAKQDYYISSGIQDIWILGYSLHRYGRSDCDTDYEKHRLKFIERAIFEDTDQELVYFDANNEEIVLLPRKTISNINYENTFVTESRYFNNNLFVKEQRYKLTEVSFSNDGDIITPYIDLISKAIEKEKLYEIKNRSQNIKREPKIEVISPYSSQSRPKIDTFTSKLLEDNRRKEKYLFGEGKKDWERLATKLGIRTNNWPDYLNIDLAGFNLLFKFDNRLWQGWIFLEFIKNKDPGTVINPNTIVNYIKSHWPSLLQNTYDNSSNLGNAIYSYLSIIASRNIIADTDTRLFRVHNTF